MTPSRTRRPKSATTNSRPGALLSAALLPLTLTFFALSSGCTQVAHRTTLQTMSEPEFHELEASLLLRDEDLRYLRMSRAVLEPHVDELLDVWYGFVGANPHLLRSFSHPQTEVPDATYLANVRTRFKDWVLATTDGKFDRAWLDHQLQIGLRHHRLGKNRTDGVVAAAHIPFRHLIALQYPITTTLRPFLARGGHSAADVEGMVEAWRKATLLTVILWSQPYVNASDY